IALFKHRANSDLKLFANGICTLKNVEEDPFELPEAWFCLVVSYTSDSNNCKFVKQSSRQLVFMGMAKGVFIGVVSESLFCFYPNHLMYVIVVVRRKITMQCN